jgi:O-antigen/teichoic acid export membrane protein
MPAESSSGHDHVGSELKRGMFVNTIGILASNFRGIFTFLIARLLGPAALGTFLVAWATTDILSKIGMFGLDEALIAFIARAEVAGEHARSRALFHLGVFLALGQSIIVAALAIAVVQFAGTRLGFHPQVVAVLSVVLCAMPGINLYGVCTAISRGKKVMHHNIWSRGVTESGVTTLAFVGAVALGWNTYAAAIGAIVGTGASGLVALVLASRLFRSAPHKRGTISYTKEGRRLLSYSASISGYDLINSLIVRLDVIMLGAFVGHAPGVTLARVGIYGAVVEVANGLRKVNQTFTPIFAPVVAGMTAGGDQREAATTFARVAQWMLWILLPMLGVLALAGGLILSIYGTEFRQGAPWLDVVAIACGANTFVGLAETVIMVQRPGINLANSIAAGVVAVIANLILIRSFGAMGAAFGILLPYLLLGFLRHRVLRAVFGWQRPWSNVGPPVFAAVVAFLPALPLRLFVERIPGEAISAVAFLLVFGLEWWWFHYRRVRPVSA